MSISCFTTECSLRRLLCALAIALSFCTPNALSEQISEEQRKKFEEVKRSIEKLKKELQKTKSSQSELQDELEKNERTIQQLDKKTKTLRSTIDNKQSRLKQLNQDQSQLQKKKHDQTELVESYINSAYRLGKQNELKLLFNQQDPAEVARMMKYFREFSASRQEKIQTFVQTLQELKVVETEISYEKSLLQESFVDLQKQKQALGSNQKKRMQTLQKLEASLGDKTKRLSVLENDRKRLESILNKVYEEINAQELHANISDFAQLKGKLPKPTKGKIVNRFGSVRAGNGLKWQGLEFRSNPGTDIIAIHHGQVVFSDYLRGHGLLIIVDHGAGFMSLYAHASNLYKELGEWVDAGEVIASVGNTGGRRDTALYFELRHNGKATNPSAWFKRA